MRGSIAQVGRKSKRKGEKVNERAKKETKERPKKEMRTDRNGRHGEKKTSTESKATVSGTGHKIYIIKNEIFIHLIQKKTLHVVTQKAYRKHFSTRSYTYQRRQSLKRNLQLSAERTLSFKKTKQIIHFLLFRRRSCDLPGSRFHNTISEA